MKRRWKIGLAIYFSLCLIFFLPMQAFAYIEPSTTTFLIQAIIGVSVAIGAGIAIYWRKAKKKISNKLNIDQKAKKDVESDNIAFYSDKKDD